MITLFFDYKSKIPLYEQLYNHIKKSIVNMELKANEKLPSKRKLANHLKISVITVESAYNQLMAEGYIKSKPKSGFYVLPYIRLNPVSKEKQVSIIEKKEDQKEYLVDFRTNQVDSLHFPYNEISKIERDVLLDEYSKHINHVDYLGYYDLRERITEFLFEYRGIKTNPESIVIGSGSEYLISLLILLLGRDLVYGVEEPGYLKNYRLYLDYGANALTVGLDESGIDINQLNHVDVVHVTPSHQFPKGIVTTIARRIELLNWANENENHYIIEDDYDSEFRFNGNPIPAMKGLDKADKVIYMNSFSKSIAPSLRLSFMVLPKKLMNKYHKSFSYFTCSVPMITQMIIEKFMKTKGYEKHLNRMKILYKNKRDYLISLFENSNLKEKIEIIGEEAGLHFLIKINTDIKLEKLIERAKNLGVRVNGINEYCLEKQKVQTEKIIVLGYSHLENKDFEIAIKLLEKAWVDIL
ncbi:PLP-dependent aminotransferase family protein [Candidatus Izemoplasma sp. B36]|uniref:MocR-like pyridoxine biosynthesis transcription factor PdxR n=1 Tax=Candidatus Izemoplasma sp. B36 TaxID=3242468 RepID=UPI003556B6B9